MRGGRLDKVNMKEIKQRLEEFEARLKQLECPHDEIEYREIFGTFNYHYIGTCKSCKKHFDAISTDEWLEIEIKRLRRELRLLENRQNVRNRRENEI